MSVGDKLIDESLKERFPNMKIFPCVYCGKVDHFADSVSPKCTACGEVRDGK